MSEANSSPPIAPRFVEMPKAVRLNVVGTENGLAVDFTYQPGDKTDDITMRLPLTAEEAAHLARMLTSPT
ncbi:hypothetical protein [Chelativorans multitrophicus]|uniref:hypothetical protein n=1 Tax=Chelativorans multitrophicus TaxID=449973 RepID=UPI0014099F56|nr:hypothetical protein [Chelativorans multitrophicus]